MSFSSDVDALAAQVRAMGSIGDVSKLADDEFLGDQASVAKLVQASNALLARYAAELARRSGPHAIGREDLARKHGHRSPAGMIATITGDTMGHARQLINAGGAWRPHEDAPRPVEVTSNGDDRNGAGDGAIDANPTNSQPAPTPGPRYPLVTSAQATGDLSIPAAGVITEALDRIAERVERTDLPVYESRFVSRARTLNLREVYAMVDQAEALLKAPELQARERLATKNRSVTWREEHDGMWTLTARLDVPSAAAVKTTIEQIARRQFRNRRDGDRTEPDTRTTVQVRADALTWLCRHAIACKETAAHGVVTTINVRMDLSDVIEGAGVATIDGMTTPVSVATMRQQACSAQFFPLVLGGDAAILDVGEAERGFTPEQITAIVERDGGCARCHLPPEHCEIHHIKWWFRDKGKTDLANGIALCVGCHHDIHREEWGIEINGREVWFIPPTSVDPARRPRPGGRFALDIGRDLAGYPRAVPSPGADVSGH
ncbi:HNH endonuclease signature motif containing protein [Demequina sp. NBRC 110055]|uniref:HNH endonuclease signature motif containing protein n=1 Tax=Demequina sp. NBRC 110055 TaxID=1570344 RepID=UPI000A02B402|nr:HNH endonuclease signature motif containing protein [Demequina sp. NBRC 110055]